MSQTNNGGPAFPIASCDRILRHGMSLRDYFAGQALAGLLANPELATDAEFTAKWSYVAKWSYLNADAMLAERQKERE